MWRLGTTLAKQSRLRAFSISPTPRITTQLRELYGLDTDSGTIDMQGLAVKHLPNIEITRLKALLGEQFGVNPAEVTVYTDIQGKPAYSVIRTEDQSLIEKGLSWHKQTVEGAKLRVFVRPKQTLEDFIRENKPLKGGFDSRKVVVLNLPTAYTEADVFARLGNVGNIMGIRVPKDYEAEPISTLWPSVYDCNLIGLESIEDSTGKESFYNHNVLIEADRHVKREADSIVEAISKIPNSDELQKLLDRAIALKEYVSTLKLRLLAKTTDIDRDIDSCFSGLTSKLKSPSFPEELKFITLRVRQAGLLTLEPHIRNKGFAIVTFATRVRPR